MPLIEDDDTQPLDTDRLTFRERLRTGRVVPIVSNRAIFNRMLGGYTPFLTNYARYVKYPLSLTQPDSEHPDIAMALGELLHLGGNRRSR